MSESQLVGRLRSAGRRATAPRRAVIGVLERSRKHLSAEDIHRSLTAGGVRIDLSSVYRTLTLLLRLRLVRPARPSERHGHFEVGHREQVHLVCSRCGGVIETGLPRAAGIEHAVLAAARGKGFALTEFTIEAAGECRACHKRPPGRRDSGSAGR
jgi:Fur family ferric uptake transcriptional regulator